ncbi:hypothetical protein LguiA_033695 [Lonicera macranthoides]
MADFSDSDDERAIQDILSQAMDHSVLEQVAAINCSAFDSDSVLPTHLETRFHKLKSFPSAKPTSQFPKTRGDFGSSSFNSQFPPPPESLKPQIKNRVDSEPDSGSQFHDGNASPKATVEIPIGKKDLEQKSPNRYFSSPSKLSDFSAENAIFSENEFFSATKRGKTKEKKGLKSKSRSGSFRSPSDSSNSSTESRSPPQRIGCFWCSPKRVSGKKSRENNRISGIDLNWGNDDELLSTFSSREQQKILKKAMKEEEKINREAEKIVKMAKQASMRMEAFGIKDELTDDDDSSK